eukprot:CAMPEP_0194363352 /NCGR_PEP_ID=MMETSP0174-20130528/11153_1 /TAXON_ID=216777 /ORGANISM="Proboscia alata, Strain PI-D3" /LENGTH=731 /DNA_ID=CAMNT_0039136709 /DNA_START=89 /DNA_END=2284 /DNA_ORIENTATION=+
MSFSDMARSKQLLEQQDKSNSKDHLVQQYHPQHQQQQYQYQQQHQQSSSHQSNLDDNRNPSFPPPNRDGGGTVSYDRVGSSSSRKNQQSIRNGTTTPHNGGNFLDNLKNSIQQPCAVPMDSFHNQAGLFGAPPPPRIQFDDEGYPIMNEDGFTPGRDGVSSNLSGDSFFLGGNETHPKNTGTGALCDDDDEEENQAIYAPRSSQAPPPPPNSQQRSTRSNSRSLLKAFNCASPNLQDMNCKAPDINQAMEKSMGAMENMMGLNDERDEEALEDLGNRHGQIRDWIIEFQMNIQTFAKTASSLNPPKTSLSSSTGSDPSQNPVLKSQFRLQREAMTKLSLNTKELLDTQDSRIRELTSMTSHSMSHATRAKTSTFQLAHKRFLREYLAMEVKFKSLQADVERAEKERKEEKIRKMKLEEERRRMEEMQREKEQAEMMERERMEEERKAQEEENLRMKHAQEKMAEAAKVRAMHAEHAHRNGRSQSQYKGYPQPEDGGNKYGFGQILELELSDSDREAHRLMQERESEIHNINQKVNTVNAIYKDLGEIIAGQQSGIDQVEGEMEEAYAQTKAGLGMVHDANINKDKTYFTSWRGGNGGGLYDENGGPLHDRQQRPQNMPRNVQFEEPNQFHGNGVPQHNKNTTGSFNPFQCGRNDLGCVTGGDINGMQGDNTLNFQMKNIDLEKLEDELYNGFDKIGKGVDAVSNMAVQGFRTANIMWQAAQASRAAQSAFK